MIHIRVDQSELNSERKFACGIGPKLPEGDKWFYGGEHGAIHADCPGCNPRGPEPIGWPASAMASDDLIARVVQMLEDDRECRRFIRCRSVDKSCGEVVEVLDPDFISEETRRVVERIDEPNFAGEAAAIARAERLSDEWLAREIVSVVAAFRTT